MIEKNKIGLMTKYLIKNILNRYQEMIDDESLAYEMQTVGVIDVDSFILRKTSRTSQISIFVQQLESLTKLYQIYKRQNQSEQVKKVEYKILNLLDLEFLEQV